MERLNHDEARMKDISDKISAHYIPEFISLKKQIESRI